MLCTVDAAFVCSVLPADAASLLPSAPLSCDGDGRRGRSISRGRGLGQNVLRLRPRSTDLQQMQDGTGRCFPPPPLPLRPLLLCLCVRVCLCVWYGAKLEPAVHRSLLQEKQQHQQFPHHLEQQWSGGNERQPPPWTDELAEMSRHIYTRHGIGEGLQKTAVFQVEQMNAPLFIYLFVSCSLSPHLWFSHLFFFLFYFISTSSLKLVCPYFTPPSLRLRHFSPTPSPLSYLPLVFPSSISSSFFFPLPSFSYLPPYLFLPVCFSIFPYLIISQLSSALSLAVSSVFLFPHLSTYPLLPSSSSSSAFHLLPFLPLPSSQHISVEVTEFLSSPPSLSLSHLSVVQSSELMILWSSSHHRSLRPSFYECGSFKKKRRKKRRN